MRLSGFAIVLPAAVALLLAGCTSTPSPRRSPPAVTAVFHSQKLEEIDGAIAEAIADHRCPGAVLWLEREGAVYRKAYGQRAVVPAPEPMTEDTVFDLASLTKVLALTPAVMRLVERGQLGLDDAVSRHLPEFTGDGKETITVRQLLTHTSGLRPDVSLKPEWSGTEAILRLACAENLQARPGERFIYSDTGPILLGEVVRRLTGRPLDQYLADEVYGPLRMTQTRFNPPAGWGPRIAPTEVEQGRPLRGTVHDPRARRMGGVAGHAGLFSTAADIARFARMLLNRGELEGVRVFKPETVDLMTRVQTPAGIEARRGLGWDIDSSYAGQRGSVFPVGGYGHTGWTGTSLWIDPFSRTFVILLSNRNHPDESGSVGGLRRRVATLAAEAVIGFNFAYVPGALAPSTLGAGRPSTPTRSVRNGIDVLVRRDFAPLKGRRVGLITNHTGHDSQRNPTIDLLHRAAGVTLVALFSPEHGIRGLLDESVGDTTDAATGLPVYSLYGQRREPSPEQLRGIDTLVFDIQDIGCRFYTYISTMGLAMDAAAKAGIRMVVLDRVNPIGGEMIDGPVHTGPSTFTAFHRLPLRHGLTVGELARLFNAERPQRCDLTVVPVEGWSRGLWFDQTGQPWTHPSPNMRSLTAATLYPGVGLLETTALSVGRGTGTPFEIVGAPYIDDVRFTPAAYIYKETPCGGVQIVLTDRDRCEVVNVGLLMASVLHRLYPGSFDLDKFNRLLQHTPTLEAIRAGKSLAEIRALWRTDLDDFQKRRKACLLYD